MAKTNIFVYYIREITQRIKFSFIIFLSRSYIYQKTSLASENTYDIFRHLPKMRMHVFNK